METVRNNSVVKHSRQSFSSSLNPEVTVFVVLTGVLGGLLLVFAVLCICRCCHKSNKSLKRQQVVFTKYSSEKRSSSGKGSRKSRSYEPSVVVDLETAYSDSSTSPREVEGLSQGTASRNSPPDTSESHKFFPEKDISRREACLDDHQDGDCLTLERTTVAFASTSSSSPKTVLSMTVDSGKRFLRSPPICRQLSVCENTLDRTVSPKMGHVGRDRRQSAPEPSSATPQRLIPQVVVAFHNEVDEGEEKEPARTCVEVYTYPNARSPTSEKPKCRMGPSTVPRRGRISMDLEQFEAKLKLLRAAAAQLAPEVAMYGPGVLASTGFAPLVNAVMGVEGLLRAPSTEMGRLEQRMEQKCRRMRTVVTHLSDEEEDVRPKAKVRYNDTGSLEEVNEELLDSFVDDIEDLEDMKSEYMRSQYRKLWALRATFEEDAQQDASEQEGKLVLQQDATSAEPSPDRDRVTSHTTSFESNTEAVEGDHEGDLCRSKTAKSDQCATTTLADDCPGPSVAKGSPDKCTTDRNCVSPPSVSAPSTCGKLLLPNPESRRQSYKSMLNRRLRRPTTATPMVPGAGGSGDNSFDSLETEDGSSTDGSRLEAVTTSVESTTDNTDSASENQMNRLQQMKADSGYKSLEANGALQLAAASTSPERISSSSDKKTRDPSQTVLDDQQPTSTQKDTLLLEVEQEEDEGVGQEPFPTAKGLCHLRMMVPVCIQEEVEVPSSSASRKRRDYYMRERQVADTRLESVDESSSVIGRLFRAPRDRQTQGPTYRVLSRDYSIDEKSDALFREFSRLDPLPETTVPSRVPTPRLSRPSSHARHHRLYHPPPPPPLPPPVHHQKQHPYYKYEDMAASKVTIRSKLSPQEGIEEEVGEVSSCRHDIPIIKVAGDEETV